MNSNALIHTMKQLGIVLAIFSSIAFANAEHPAEKLAEPKQVVDELYKKCLAHAKHIRDEEVCKARKPAIELCVEQETKAKDSKAAKIKCELLFLAPSK